MMLGLFFSSKLDWGSYIAKTASKKILALIRSMFLYPEVAVYLYKSTLQPCMEYCCHVWAGDPSYLEMLDKPQKQIFGTVAPSLATCLEPLAHNRNRVDVHLNLHNCFHFLVLEGCLPIILKDCMIFLSPFLYALRMYMSQFFSFHSQTQELSAYSLMLICLLSFP